MGVLITTRLWPAGAALSAAAWSSRESPPWSGKTCSGATRGSCLRTAATASLISFAPGRNTKISPPSGSGCSFSARVTVEHTASDRSNRPRPGAPTYSVRTGNARPSLATIGARFLVSPPTASSESSLDPSTSAAAGPTSPSVADITTSLRSGRSAARTSVASARQRSASRLRSWNSSNTTALTFSSPGSCCSRRASIPSVTTSILVSRLTLESNRTRYPTVLPTGSPRISAMRLAAARAASRRGSSTTMTLSSPSQPGRLNSIARGRVVVLPAPGGA